MVMKFFSIAEVCLKLKSQIYLMELGLADYLPFPVVLGRDLLVFWDLLQPAPTCNVVVTQANVREGETSQLCRALTFFETEMEISDTTKLRKSHRQNKQDKIKYTAAKMSDNPLCEFSSGFKLPLNLAQLQHDDGSNKTSARIKKSVLLARSEVRCA